MRKWTPTLTDKEDYTSRNLGRGFQRWFGRKCLVRGVIYMCAVYNRKWIINKSKRGFQLKPPGSATVPSIKHTTRDSVQEIVYKLYQNYNQTHSTFPDWTNPEYQQLFARNWILPKNSVHCWMAILLMLFVIRIPGYIFVSTSYFDNYKPSLPKCRAQLVLYTI